MVDEVKLNGVHILSLQQLNENKVLIRFENYLSDVKRKISLKVCFILTLILFYLQIETYFRNY